MGTLTPLLLGLPLSGGEPDKVRQIVEGRLVVITGASRGIGREMVRRLAVTGALVIGIARTSQALSELEEEFEDSFTGIVGDLRDSQWAQECGQQILRQWGTPDLLISNAGHSIHRSFKEYAGRFHDVQRTDAVNYLGAVALSLPILEAMTERGSGHLISVSSTSVGFPVPNWSVYAASKGAHEEWLRRVAPELAVAGVAVTSIHMPRVSTAMSAPTKGRYPMPELNVDQAADLICRVIVTRPRFVIPWWARASAAIAATCPTTVSRVWEAALRAGVRP